MAGDLVVDRWYNGDGTENYKCRAWINFNGTGTVAARAAGNATVVDNGVGDYTINFTAAMPDADYAVLATGGRGSGAATGLFTLVPDGSDAAVGSVRVRTVNNAFGLADASHVSLAVFR